jgi:hypothetical protein
MRTGGGTGAGATVAAGAAVATGAAVAVGAVVIWAGVLSQRLFLHDWQPVSKMTATTAIKETNDHCIKHFAFCINFLWILQLLIRVSQKML